MMNKMASTEVLNLRFLYLFSQLRPKNTQNDHNMTESMDLYSRASIIEMAILLSDYFASITKWTTWILR